MVGLRRSVRFSLTPPTGGFPDAPDNSLFLRFYSLFGSNISLLHLVGNLVEIGRNISALSGSLRLVEADFRDNSLFFPCITGN